MTWSDYMKNEGYKEYYLQDLIEVPVPEGEERDNLIRRIAESANVDEAREVVKKAIEFWK
jgi:hypothetical protein